MLPTHSDITLNVWVNYVNIMVADDISIHDIDHVE